MYISNILTQINLSAVFFVTGVTIELRKDAPQFSPKYAFYGVRIGMEDASTLGSTQTLTINKASTVLLPASSLSSS